MLVSAKSGRILRGSVRIRGSVNRRVVNVTIAGIDAIQSFGELPSRKSCQPIDGSSKRISHLLFATHPHRPAICGWFYASTLSPVILTEANISIYCTCILYLAIGDDMSRRAPIAYSIRIFAGSRKSTPRTLLLKLSESFRTSLQHNHASKH